MGIVERKEREKQMRKETLLQAAQAVFFEKGLRAATLDEIAERAEVSKGTIYLYFASKEDLYYSLMTRGLILLLKMFQDARPEETTPAEAISRFADAYLRFSIEQSYLFKMLAVVEGPAVSQQVSQEIFSELEEASDKVLSYVAEFVQKGIDEGSFRSDVSSHEVVVLFWVSLSGILNLKERSSAMKKSDCLKADSIVGSVDFSLLYSKYQRYLVDFLTPEVTSNSGRRNTAGKSKEGLKQSKAVTRK